MTDQAAPTIGQGNVELPLVNLQTDELETFTLRPNYNAARILSNQAGGLVGVMERVARLDVDIIVGVIQMGLGQGTAGAKVPKDLPQRVWATGLSDDSGGVADRCITYIRILMSGGKAIRTQDENQGPN